MSSGPGTRAPSRTPWLVLMLLMIVAAGRADRSVVEVRSAGDPQRRLEARAALEAGADALTLADEVTLVLSVEGPAPLRVTAPRPLFAQPHLWRLRRETTPIREVLPNQRERWTQRFVISPLQAGPVPVPVGPLTVQAGGEPETQIDWQNLKHLAIEVRPPPGDVSVAALRPPTDLEVPEIPPPSTAADRSWLIVIPFGLLLVAALLLLLARRRRPVEMPRDPAWAIRELKQHPHDLDRAVVTLRTFLAAQLGIPTHTRTMPELTDSLRQHPGLVNADGWVRLLNALDTARFAPTATPPDSWLEQALGLIAAFPVEPTTSPHHRQ